MMARQCTEQSMQLAPALLIVGQHPAHHGVIEEGTTQRLGQCGHIGTRGGSNLGAGHLAILADAVTVVKGSVVKGSVVKGPS